MLLVMVWLVWLMWLVDVCYVVVEFRDGGGG
jgi:hypothetical protein